MKKIIKGIVIVEIVAVAAAYRIWKSLNTNQGKHCIC